MFFRTWSTSSHVNFLRLMSVLHRDAKTIKTLSKRYRHFKNWSYKLAQLPSLKEPNSLNAVSCLQTNCSKITLHKRTEGLPVCVKYLPNIFHDWSFSLNQLPHLVCYKKGKSCYRRQTLSIFEFVNTCSKRVSYKEPPPLGFRGYLREAWWPHG